MLATPMATPQPITLLIVEDEETVLETLEDYLRAKGYEIRTTRWAKEAATLYASWRPALVLLDIRLPDGDGLDVLRRIRAQDPQARVVMITAVHDLEWRRQALADGAAGFFFKPVEVTALDRILRTAAGVAETAGSDRPTVMILDDEPEIRVGLKYYLIGRGLNVQVAGSAEEALSFLRTRPVKPQVLVLDLMLPKLSGMDFLKLIHQANPELAVIILTGLGATSSLRQQAQQHGVRQFFTKPVSLDVLETAIRGALKS